MYQIKQFPEDFIVKEIKDIEVQDNGKYSYYLLKKKDYTTVKASEIIARKNHLKLKDIGFAGTKDRKAITYQYISVKGNLRYTDFKGFNVTKVGHGDKPISLGELWGNEFVIVIRDINDDEVEKVKKFENNFKNLTNNNLKHNKTKIVNDKIKNYFGEQRFSKNNSDVGKAIVKKDFKKAIELILENDGDYELNMKEYLKKKQKDYVGAIKLIPLKIRKMFVHAYQSHLWNIIAKDINDEDLQILGFATEDIEKYKTIMKKERITQRDFIIRQMPELSAEGGIREVMMEVKDFMILKEDKDKIEITFKLKKGSYATELIRQILS